MFELLSVFKSSDYFYKSFSYDFVHVFSAELSAYTRFASLSVDLDLSAGLYATLFKISFFFGPVHSEAELARILPSLPIVS